MAHQEHLGDSRSTIGEGGGEVAFMGGIESLVALH